MSDARQRVADDLGVDPEDLVLVADDEPSYRLRRLSTGDALTAHVSVGPEGPVVTVDGADA